MSDSGLGSSNTSPTARKALGLMLKVLVRLADSSEIESESLSMSGLTVPVFISKLVAEILTSAARAGSHSPSKMFEGKASEFERRYKNDINYIPFT